MRCEVDGLGFAPIKEWVWMVHVECAFATLGQLSSGLRGCPGE